MSSDIDTQLQRLLDQALASTDQAEVEQLLTECGLVLDQRVATANRSNREREAEKRGAI